MGGRGGALGRPAEGANFHDMTAGERDTLMRSQWADELRAMGLDPSDISYVKNKAYEMGRGYVATGASFGINNALRDGTPLTHTQAEVVSRMDIATNKTLGADLNLVRYVGGTTYLPKVLGVSRGSLLRMSDAKLTELSTSLQGKIVAEKVICLRRIMLEGMFFRICRCRFVSVLLKMQKALSQIIGLNLRLCCLEILSMS